MQEGRLPGRGDVREPSERALRRARFEAIALPLAGRLRAAARRSVRRADIADDLVQETCLRAYRGFETFAPGTNERAWLFTVLYSVCIDHHRREGIRATQSIEEFEERFGRPLALPDPRAEAAIHEQPSLAWFGSDAERALALLPEPYRSAVELVDLAELSYEEAATALDCPVGTLRSRLFRGRRALALVLGGPARTLAPDARKEDPGA